MTTDDLIYSTAIADGMPAKLALFLVAQARHETGNYKHRFFTVGNNAFGYSYYAGSKWQLPTGGPLADNGIPIAQYANVQDSVHEITDWIRRRQREGKFPVSLETITTPETYAQLLKNSGYFRDPLQVYTDALINWLRTIGTEAFSATGGGIGLIIILLVFIFRKRLFGR